MVKLKKEDILGNLRDFDDEVTASVRRTKGKYEIVILGGAAFIVLHGSERGTVDIDTINLDKQISVIAKRFFINDAARRVAILPQDYASRLVKSKIVYKSIVVYYLGAIDLVATKLQRGDAKDLADIVDTNILAKINKKELIRVCDKLANEWTSVFSANWEYVKRNYL